jgi:hypothetical protein
MKLTWIMMATVATALDLGFASFAGADTYTFENLASGANLAGQDNWKLLLGSSSVVTSGTGVDTTKIAQSIYGAGGTVTMLTRTNDSNFSFPQFAGTETAATLQFDVFMGLTSSSIGNFGANFGLGHGSDIGAQFGINGGLPAPFGPGGDFFELREPGFGTDHLSPVPASVLAGDWLRLRLVMDFTANGGDGAGSMLFADLTAGSAFSPITGLQNIDLNLSNSAASWDEMFLRLDEFDSRAPMGADNLVVSQPSSATPLPSAAWGGMALLGGFGLMKARRRFLCR